MMRFVGLGRMLLVWSFGLLPALTAPAHAATNSARAGIGGLDNGTIQNGDGTGSARITVNSVPLALHKQARDAGGVPLPDGAGVRPDQVIWFVLRVENPTPFPAVDIRLIDPIDETQFTYIAGSLERCFVPVGTSDASLWTAAWAQLSDGVGSPDDEGSVADTEGGSAPDRLTVGLVPGQSNVVVTIPPNSTLAVRFRVRVY